MNITTDKNQSKKYLIFRLDHQRYGIALSLLREVINVCDITPVPNAEVFYKGLLNLRGQIISTIDLRTLLNYDEKAMIPRQSAIIISRVGPLTIGSIVDEVIEVANYDFKSIKETTDSVKMAIDESISVTGEVSGGITIILDLEQALKGTKFQQHLENAA